MTERSQQNLPVQRKVFEHLLVVYVPKPKLRALQQQDISILKSARKRRNLRRRWLYRRYILYWLWKETGIWSNHKNRNHTWDDGKTTTEPTCTINGITTFTCSVCGKTKTRSIKAAGHSYGEYVVVKEPTSTEKGLKSKTCSVCGKVYSVTLAKTDSSNANIKIRQIQNKIHRQISIPLKD